MHRIQLIHWNAAETRQRAELLSTAGYAVNSTVPAGPELLRELRNSPPTAVAIDLARLPSQGRDVALAIRQSRATRHVPLVFIGGHPKKVRQIRDILPDAVYCEWSRIRSGLRQAIVHPPRNPVVPTSVFAGYAGKALSKKLGIKAHSVVALVDAPRGFKQILGDLPEGTELSARVDDHYNLAIWVTQSLEELQSGVARLAARAGQGPIWIVWPKKTSHATSDLSQQSVREVGLAAGLVDYKICSLDATWSGLLFARRKSRKRV